MRVRGPRPSTPAPGHAPPPAPSRPSTRIQSPRQWWKKDDNRGRLSSALLSLLLTVGAPATPPAAHAAFIPLEDRPALAVTSSAIRFLASPRPDIAAVQAALVEAWGALRDQYVEPTAVTGPAWEAALRGALASAAAAADTDAAWGVVEDLVGSLGDQYTRVLRPESGGSGAYAADLAGLGPSLGLQLTRQPSSSSVTVAAVVPGSPADATGVVAGQEVVAVNGVPAARVAPEDLARALAAEADLELRGDGRPTRTVHLTPALVPLHAVQHAHLAAADGARGGAAYLRIAAFNDLTPGDVAAALAALAPARPAALILDLRDNAGGAVAAAVDVAGQLLLDGGRGTSTIPPPLLALVRDGRGGEEAVPVPRPAATTPAWPPSPRLPTAVLINGGTASSSELLVGALAGGRRRDGGGGDGAGADAGALLVGEKTFGKGRTQRSIQLGGPGGGGGGDKALLLVSNRTFTTPAGEAVDGVGLRPAVACVPGSTEAAFFVSGDGGGGHDGPGGSTALAEALLGDPCVRLAAAELGVQLRVENEM